LCCLFSPDAPCNHGSKDQAEQAENAENEEAIGVGIGCQSKDAFGLGNEPLATKHIVEKANWCLVGSVTTMKDNLSRLKT